MIKSIELDEIQYVVFETARKLLTFDEPIPNFSTRFPNILESCLKTPFQKFDRSPLYKTLVEKAAIFFYLMIKNHPFENGNKRIAVVSLFYFLFKNKKWIKTTPLGLYKIAVWVAETKPKNQKETIQRIEKFIRTFLSDK